jgi:hypothetical protein
MYNAHQQLAHIDANEWKIIALCAVAMCFNYAWFIAAFRVARRDRVYSVPVLSTLFWLVGDSSFLWHYDQWFHTYKDWYPELFWIALVLTVLFELAFTAQLIQYGRKELLPSASQRQFAALVLAGIGVAIVLWSLVRHIIVDPLWINYFALANFVGPIFGAGLVIKRRSRAGQTPMIWVCYAAMAGCWYVAESLWFGPTFQTDEYVAVGIVTVAASLAVAYALSRMPAYEPEPLPAPDRSPAGAAPALGPVVATK